MVTVDQFLRALAVVESSDNPEAWGDAGRAMGRWQVHPDRLWSEANRFRISPKLGETWDQLIARVLRRMWSQWAEVESALSVAMYWHLGHFTDETKPDWDGKYAARFDAALTNAIAEMP